MTGNVLYFSRRQPKEAAGAPAQESLKPEALLVERIRAGELEAFNEFYKTFAPMVHGIVLARVPRDEAADLVQNVFLIAHKNLHALREPNAVGAWLAMIARNQANEFYRKSKPTEEISENVRHNDKGQTEAREILAAIKTLPDAYRETLIMRLVEGMSGPEIAGSTGLTPESVRVNLHRGMKLLRQKLGIKE